MCCLEPGTIFYSLLKCPPDEVGIYMYGYNFVAYDIAAFSGHGYGKPTYGELIDVFVELEGRAGAADLLCSEICRRYPGLMIGRPSRLFDTIQRIVGPTRASLRGTAKLTGSPLASYRRRVWEPRIRTTGKYSSNEDIKTYYFIYFYRECHGVSTRTKRTGPKPGSIVFNS